MMEIEKLIDSLKKCAVHQSCVDCMFASDEGNCIDSIMRNAAHTLEQLQSENDRLKRERDAAVESWRGFCSQCAWKNHQYLADGKMDDRCRTCRDNAKCNWKWRGLHKEE